jgi:predicted ribosomally synthesized peptide with SipW-like signal peptide
MLRFRTSPFVAFVAFVTLSIVLSSLPGVARAVPVAPGEAVNVSTEGTFTPTGTLEQEESRAVSLTFTAPGSTTFDPEGLQTTATIDGTFQQQVFRDPATNRLAFVYTVQLDQPDLESIDYVASSFLNFTTDIDGTLGGIQGFAVTRSADGATLTATRDQGLAGSGGTFAVFTDAENFNASGTLGLEATNEFATYDASGSLIGATGVVSDAFTLDAVFQPETQIDPPPPGVIPLPAAVWPGMILLGATAMKLRRRVV